MSRARSLVTLVALAGGLLAGCSGSQTSGLTDEQRGAVNTAVAITETAAVVVGALATIVGVDFEGPAQEVSGTCPVVGVVRETSQVTIDLDYGGGCDSQLGVPIGGTMTAVIDRGTNTGTVTLDGFTVDGRTVTGTIGLGVTLTDNRPSQLAVDLDLTTSGVGSVVGAVTIVPNPNQTATVSGGPLTYTDLNDTSYTVTLNGLTVDPLGNENVLPEGGSMTVSYQDGSGRAVTLGIAFSSATPTTGQVAVTVNGVGPFAMTLPGF